MIWMYVSPFTAVSLASVCTSLYSWSLGLQFLMLGYKELKKWETPQTTFEYRSQFSLFAILAAPLIFSADIRGTQNGTYVGHNGVHHSTYNGWTRELQTILLNKDVIAVSQDPLGKQGRLYQTRHAGHGNCTVELYARQLFGDALAVAALNRCDIYVPPFDVRFAEVGLPSQKAVVSVHNLWLGKTAPHDTAMFRLAVHPV
jgi:alpha-galactosidase